LRQGLNSDLGFSDEDRLEQARRVACLAEILTKQGYSIIVSLISPQIKGRSMAREILKEQQFIEVFVDVPIEECAKRDSKGLYKLAHKGEISQFTGIGSPYEPPVKPEIRIDNLTHSALENAVKIKDFLAIKKLIC
jgi:bifunctional enzyme CysN/CysC